MSERPTAAPDRAQTFEEAFVADANADMLRRMRDGTRRGWADSFRDDYPDTENFERLERAVRHLSDALHNYRMQSVGVDEVRKRAADVANQAFMLADPERLR